MKLGLRRLKPNTKVVSKLMFRLLPVQVLLVAAGAVNGIVSSFFASNYLGIDAMSAVGLYNPVHMLIVASSVLLSGGSAVLCARYLGRNEQDKMQNVFSLNLVAGGLAALVFTVLLLFIGSFNLTWIFTGDESVRIMFSQYLAGQVLGVFPLILGNQLPTYLFLENRRRRSVAASLVYIGVNVFLDLLFVQVLRMQALGLALASSLGLWAFFFVQAFAFPGGRSFYKLRLRKLHWAELKEIAGIGLDGALGTALEAVRKIIVNYLLVTFIGNVAISSFAASDSLLRIFWAVPFGMQAVSRIMFSISVGEEDRQTLTDVMRVMFRRFLPLMAGICAVVILCAHPFTRLFFRDPSSDVYLMTVRGFRILPLCMVFSIVCMHFSSYGNAAGKSALVNLLAVLDSLVFVSGFTAVLIPWLKMDSVYFANLLNGVGCVLVILGYSCLKVRRFPRNMEQLMAVPDDFGTSEDERIDISVRSMEEVVSVARRVRAFCGERGIDERRVYLSGLCLEEMAGNIVEHGFAVDRKRHSIDIRVVHKDDVVILRIRDDCIPFNPAERREMFDPKDIMKNAGIRIVYRIARDINYQNIMGLNELTIRI